MTKKLIFLQLNELNFDAVREYLELGYSLPNFERVLKFTNIITTSEKRFDFLEPWIQWPSVHTGKSFPEHQIFRLGDSAVSCPNQIFELLESQGLKVGAISPMNAVNALCEPCYFIPDPWTETRSDGGFFSEMLTSVLRQTVNDNSKGTVTIKSKFYLAMCFVFLVRPKAYFALILKALKSRGLPWRKALFLDRFLHEIHLSWLRKHSPNFSVVFLNGAAHIQHHYLLSSKIHSTSKKLNPDWYVLGDRDPFGEMLKEYDQILGDVLAIKGSEVLIATGLTQQPVEKPVFYYRLRDHEKFLSRLGLRYVKVSPRMTRDFLIACQSREDALEVDRKLSGIITREGVQIFAAIDNRGSDLFVTLSYGDEISAETEVLIDGEWVSFFSDVVFVAIKNGEHEGRGFAFFSGGIETCAPEEKVHVAKLFDTICEFFVVKQPSE